MCKVRHQSENSKCTDTYLDTLEVTTEIFQSKTHASLYSSALRKKKTLSKIYGLIDVTQDKRMRLKYWSTYHCKNVLLQDGQTLKGSLCRNRWCMNCSRIKTAEMINGYGQPLTDLGSDLYFVTLTAPTINASKLRTEIRKRIRIFQQCQDALRKQGIKLNGMRKLEITYNTRTDKYHPHFHFIQQGKYESECLRDEWVKRFRKQQKKATKKAQDVRPINDLENGFIELFKYATKDSVKDTTPSFALDVIYQSIEGTRIYQPYGKLRKVKKPIEKTDEVHTIDFIPPKMDIWVYEPERLDWVNGYNENLIGTEGIILENNKRIAPSDVLISVHLNV